MSIKAQAMGLAAALAALASIACGQVVESHAYPAGFQFVDEPVDARAVAMGSAGTALDSRGFYYYNPALPALSGSRSVSFEYGQQSGDLQRAEIEGSWCFPHWFVALGIPTSGITDIQAADEHGTLPMTFSSQGTMIAVSAGYIWKGLAVALGFHGMQDRIDTYTGYALSMSAGATYWILPSRLSVGAAGFYPKFLTTARGMIDEKWGDGAEVGRMGRVGVAWRDTLASIRYAAALDVVYDDALENVTVPVGLEVWPLKMLAIRVGKRFNHDTDMFNFGLGLRFAPISIDASFVVTDWSGDSGLKWLVGISYSLPRT